MTQPASDGLPSRKQFACGDVVEISTGDGHAYVQVTHLHHSYPEIVRVLPGLHETACDNLDLLVQLPTCFTVMTPLAAGISNGQLTGRYIGGYPIPKAEQDFPSFRTPVRNRLGDILYWWLWDGDGLSYVDSDATSSQQPIREVVPSDELRKRLVEQLSRRKS